MMALTSLKAKSINAAKQAKYSPQEQTAGMRAARWNKLCNTVDPEHSLTDSERNRRAEALLKSQMYAMVDARERKRKATKAQQADAAILAIVQPAKGCSLCRPLVNETHETCAMHKDEMKQRLSR